MGNKRVQISDFEDSVILPAGKYLRDGLCGNPIWSPESWARAAQGTTSDIFSFGVVVSRIWAVISAHKMKADLVYHLVYLRPSQ